MVSGRRVWLVNGDRMTAPTIRFMGPMIRPAESPLLSTSVPDADRTRRKALGHVCSGQLEYQVIGFVRAGDIISGVVENVDGAEGRDEFHIRCAADTDHGCPEGSGDLNCKRPDTT